MWKNNSVCGLLQILFLGNTMLVMLKWAENGQMNIISKAYVLKSVLKPLSYIQSHTIIPLSDPWRYESTI